MLKTTWSIVQPILGILLILGGLLQNLSSNLSKSRTYVRCCLWSYYGIRIKGVLGSLDDERL